MKNKNHIVLKIGLVMLTALAVTALPLLCLAASDISGHYSNNSADNITLRISVGSPPPQSLIITQKLPVGITLVSSRPPYNKLRKKTNEAKWLFSNVEAGNIIIQMNLSKPVSSGDIQATLRYRDNKTGKINTLSITN